MKRLILVGIALVGLSAGCAQIKYIVGAPQIDQTSQEKQVPEWIGKDRGDLVSKWGEPSLAVPMESGAEELYYSYGGHHYYFETDLRGFIKTAVQTD